jgi:hypothetical protein
MAIFDSKIAADKCQANEAGLCSLSKQCYVIVDEAITVQRSDESANAKKAAKGQFRGRSRFAAHQKKHPVDTRRETSDEERKNRRSEAKEGGNHGDKFDVAQTHALTVPNRFIKPPDEQKQHCRPADGSDTAEDQRLRPSQEDVAATDKTPRTVQTKLVGRVQNDLILSRSKKNRLNTNKKKSNRNAWKREGIRKQHGLPVHHHQTNKQEAKDSESESPDVFGWRWPTQSAYFSQLQQKQLLAHDVEPKSNRKLNEWISP